MSQKRRVFSRSPIVPDYKTLPEILPASRDHLHAVFDLALDAMLLANDQQSFVDANPAACRLLGYEYDELMQLGILDITTPAERESAAQRWVAFLRAGKAEGQLPLARKDGIRLEAEFRAVANIRPGIHLSILRDITARKRLEAGLRESERTAALGVLAGGAAHDLNNLLVGVIGNASLAQALLDANSPAAGLVGEILQAGERAAQLTRHMLAYARKVPPHLELVNITKLVRETGVLIRSIIPKQVRMEYRLQEVPLIQADPEQVQQVMMNLIINAGQAMYEQSPGVVSIRTDVRKVTAVPAEPEAAELPPGDYAALEIEDTGRGMDAETRARIFTPFFTTKVKGRGLGLAAVSGIVREHHGAIWVHSSTNRGSCFTVLFPAAVSQRVGDRKEDSPERMYGHARVLVIEKETLVQRMAATELEESGYDVTVLADGRDALSLLESEEGHFDLVLLDLGLAGVPGQNLVNDIRRLRPGATLLLSSTRDQEGASGWLEKAGLSGFLQKPYTAEQLKTALKDALSAISTEPHG